MIILKNTLDWINTIIAVNAMDKVVVDLRIVLDSVALKDDGSLAGLKLKIHVWFDKRKILKQATF